MKLNQKSIDHLTAYFSSVGLMPDNANQYLSELSDENFIFREQLVEAESIHLHIKVADVADLPHTDIIKKGGQPQNAKDGYIKYSFPDGINFIFSSIPVSQEEKIGIASFNFPHLDHIGIDIRNENKTAYFIFNKIPTIASSKDWPIRKQGGDGKKVYCCHVQVNEKYWVYPADSIYWEFAFGKLLVSEDVFGCDLRPADPALGLSEEDSKGCCGSTEETESKIFTKKKETLSIEISEKTNTDTYYKSEDLKKFGKISEFQPELAGKFFDYYGEVFKDSALTAREKSLIALAVSHTVQCPYCIDAYSVDARAKGYSKEQMMEAIHVAAAIRGGASLVHGVQMMNKVKELS